MSRCKQCRSACRAEDRDERFCRKLRKTMQSDAPACADGFQISARAFMESIARADKRLEDMSMRAQRYRENAHRATGSMEAARVSGTAGRSRIETNMNRCIDIARDIEREAEQLRAQYERARSLIAGVSDPAGREVLELRYLSRMRWEEIAGRMHYDERQVRRIHGLALREVDAQMYSKAASAS